MEFYRRKRLSVSVFLLPALLIYLVFMIIPVLWSFWYMFFSGSPVTGFTFAGLGNFVRLMHDPNFYASLIITLKYALIVTCGQIILGLALSLIFVFNFSNSYIVRTITFLPIILPTVAVAEVFQKLFAITPQYGLVNALLSVLGLKQYVLAWLALPGTSFWVLCVMDIWRAIGFYAVLLYAGLIEIPVDIYEAAKIDGAGGFQLIRLISLPLLRPVLMSAVIFSINGTIKVFDSPVALTNGGPGNATTTLALYMYNSAFSYGDYGYGSTIAFVLFVLSLIVTGALFIFRRGD
ncbi:MAG: sugar ABC transporter permease [Alicyclobacillus sp.]|nr:sugar ABC transporter permease [Alicyclobacillus sp.]